MALLETPICDFGEKIIDFKLQSVNNSFISLNDIKGKNGTLVMFLCNHCPYVKAIIEKLVITTRKLDEFGINSIAIMPNDVENYPEDSFDEMKKFSSSNNFNFHYLYDETQKVSKLFGAVCTPDIFGYNKNDELQYRGRIAKMKDLKFVNDENDLLDAMIKISKTNNGPVNQYPSAGCSIKWKINE